MYVVADRGRRRGPGVLTECRVLWAVHEKKVRSKIRKMKIFRKKKRLLSLLIVLCMLVTLMPGQAFAAGGSSGQEAQQKNPFSDVKTSDWFYDAVQYARVNGFFSGTSTSTFTPYGTMTRGMFVTVLGRMAGVDASAYSGGTEFTDVAESQYYAPYVRWAAKHGITSGTSKGKFSPDAFIDRQQMAAFFVRYFEKFNVDYDTGANITTAPSDIDSVAEYARDAVMKLWKTGLLTGNNGKFDPKASATRAQTATLCMRCDNSVKTWYKEPGVASDRVKVDPKDENNTQAPDGQKDQNSQSSSSNKGHHSSKTYYEVKFAMVNDKDSTGITWPSSSAYEVGTLITDIATPFKKNAIFLGWYYDATGEKAVESGDTVDRDMTLYADMAEGSDVSGIETPNYVTVEVDPENYTFGVDGSNIESGLKITCVTGGNQEISYSVSGHTVSAAFEAGQTYQAELTDDSLSFVVGGTEQKSYIRYLNIITKKKETLNAELNRSLKYIPADDVKGLDMEAYKGLYTTDVSTQTTENNNTTGTFTYDGKNIYEGDTVAIYTGKTRPDQLDPRSDDGDIAYVNITKINGNTYTYEIADVEDVLSVPDIIPISHSADRDNNDNNGSITVENTVITSALKNVEASSLDIGDFIAFCDTYSDNGSDSSVKSYGRITSVSVDEDNDFVIKYDNATKEDTEKALDVYYEQNEDIEASESEKKEIKKAVAAQIMDSDYIEQASRYLAAYALETDGFKTVPKDMDINSRMDSIGDFKVTAFGSKLKAQDVAVQFVKNNVQVHVTNGHLDKLNGNGIGVSVVIPFEVSIGNNIKITVKATLEEQVILNTSVSTKRIKIKFLKYDYALNAGFTVGNYTGIKFEANVATDGGDGSLVSKLDEIMDIMEKQAKGNDVNSTDGTMESLSSVYQELMENANDSWIDLIDQKIFGSSGNAFLHIFCWEIKGSFVVSANLNVSIGMTYEYTAKKQYNFSVRVKAKTSTNQTIDLITPNYNFDFYVVGMLGVRAGLRLEMYVGLFSLKVDRIGIMAEVGAYAQLWGYFFYHLDWTQGVGKNENYAGAMLIEIGTYIDIKFLAQLFNSSKLSWNPTIYAHQWPMWSAGSADNIYGFNKGGTTYDFKTVKTLSIPGDTFLMNSMNLKTGVISQVNKDDSEEKNFTISFTNKAFTYNAETNTVTVDPKNGSISESTEMTIRWKNAPLALTSKPIIKVIKINWTNPEGVRYISFDSQGGSAVDQLSGGAGSYLAWPAAPIKQGYNFAGWYTDKKCTISYSEKDKMPDDFGGGAKGVTLYAKWNPAEDTEYNVEYYQQELNGTYKLDTKASEIKTGTTGSDTPASYDKTYDGFYVKNVERAKIAADGSTIVKVYFDRNEYTVTFDGGAGNDVPSVTQKYLYGAALNPPVMTRTGYTFAGWNEEIPKEKTVTSSETYTAKWTADPVTYKVKHIRQSVDGTYPLSGSFVESEIKDSTTGAQTEASAREYPGFTAQSVVQKNAASDSSTVIEIKYKRNSYNVSWNVNGGNELKGEYTKGEVMYGTSIVKPETPTKAGYVFGGWYKDSGCTNAFDQGATVPVGGLMLYAKWDASKDTKYTVKHYQQTLAETDTAGYELAASDQLTGTTGQPTTAAAKSYDGFEHKAFAQAVIAADGSTVVNIYYDRKSYEVSWNVNGGNALAGSYTNGTVRFGTPVIKPDTPTKAGYKFAGWYTDSNCTNALSNDATVPVGGLTLYARWTPSDDTQYTVRHYTQDLGNSEYTLAYTDDMTGTTGQRTAAKARDIAGFTAGEVTQKTITADGTTVVEIRYSRNSYKVNWVVNGGSKLTGEYTDGSVLFGTPITMPESPTKQGYVFTGWYMDENIKEKMPENESVLARDMILYAGWEPACDTAYKVNYYKQNLADNEYTLATSKDMTGVTDDLTNAKSVKYDGFTMKSFEQQKIKPDGSTVIDIYYDRNSYNISWDVNKGNELAAGDYTNGSVKFETPIVSPADPERTGYRFVGWYIDSTLKEALSENATVPAKDLTIYAKWLPNDGTEYTVNYYVENVDDDDYTLESTETMIGKSGEMTKVDPKKRRGFSLKKVENKEIDGEGTTVIDVYYQRTRYKLIWRNSDGKMPATMIEDNGTWKHDYLVEDGVIDFSDDHTTGTVKHGQKITPPSQVTIKAGYKLKGWCYSCEDGIGLFGEDMTIPDIGYDVGSVLDLPIYARVIPDTDTESASDDDDQDISAVTAQSASYDEYTYGPDCEIYDIEVAGLRVTSANAANIPHEGEGTISYDEETNTLILDNVNIIYDEDNEADPEYGQAAVIRSWSDRKLNVKLIGDNCITSKKTGLKSEDDDMYICGIYAYGGLNIEGDDECDDASSAAEKGPVVMYIRKEAVL